MSKLYKIGVTGNICSGKSSLIKYMKKKPNCITLNLDDIVHQIYRRNIFLEKMIKENFCFPDENSISQKIFYDYNKIFQEFNRKELGKIVFNDDNKINTLNKLLKTELREKMLSDLKKIEFDLNEKINNKQIQNSKKYFLFVEGAMIIEAGFQVKIFI